MSTLTFDNRNPAAPTTIWARFADWAYRTLDRLPSVFEDADPVMLRHLPPF